MMTDATMMEILYMSIYLSQHGSGLTTSDVPLGEIWFAIRSALWWVCSALLRLWQFNPFSVVVRRQQQLYQFDCRGDYSIKPPWTERIADFFRTGMSAMVCVFSVFLSVCLPACLSLFLSLAFSPAFPAVSASLPPLSFSLSLSLPLPRTLCPL